MNQGIHSFIAVATFDIHPMGGISAVSRFLLKEWWFTFLSFVYCINTLQESWRHIQHFDVFFWASQVDHVDIITGTARKSPRPSVFWALRSSDDLVDALQNYSKHWGVGDHVTNEMGSLTCQKVIGSTALGCRKALWGSWRYVKSLAGL